MMSLDEHFRAALASFTGKRFLIGCSGGLDSIVLAELALRTGLSIELAHVNYGLRGSESDEDEDFVRKFAAQHGIHLHIKKIEPSELQGNIQAAAREIRYQWFEELLHDRTLDFVLLGHHRDDQIETFYLNLGRASGFMGLSCMPFQRDRILRPLLDREKEELQQFALREGIQWHEDASNTSLKYARNRLRQEILPVLTEQIPDLKESVSLLIRHFQEAQLELETTLRPVADVWRNTRMMEISRWTAMSAHEKVELLRQLQQVPSLMKHLDQLAEAEKGAQLPLIAHPDFPFHTLVRDRLHFQLVQKQDVNSSFQLHIEQVKELLGEFDKDSIYLDEAKIVGKLALRPWQQGDRIASVGMRGTQLISEIISDAAIPYDQKDQVLVLHDAVHIHWCPGLKIGREALATKGQQSGILRCTILKAATQGSDAPSALPDSED